MGQLGVTFGFRRPARVVGLGIACLALANCSSSNLAGKIDPRYGVAASARVVESGQPVPKGGGVYRVGKPYAVAGRFYVPEENINYTATGLASWYGNDFHGRYTANGEIFDMNSISAAHPTLPLPSYVRVTNLSNRRSIIVRVNDRGPYTGDRVIDLSVRTAQLLGYYGLGLTRVKVEYVGRAPLEGSDDRKLLATLREGAPADVPVQVASSKPFAPAFFGGRAVANFSSNGVPSPPDRPFRLGEDARNLPAAEPQMSERPTQRRDNRVMRAPLPDVEATTAPISAYASTRYDGRAGFMSGRGLY